jgi:hypothetical protein
MHSYVTLSALEAQLIASNQGDDLATNRANLMAFARRVTTRIDTYTGDTFAPVREKRYFDCAGENIDLWTRALYLGASVADVVAITDGAGDTLTYDEDWRYRPRGTQSVKYLEGLSANTWTRYTDNWRQAIEIDAVWCYRTRYDTLGWVNSADTVQNTGGINATATSVTVTSTTGANAWGIMPRFDVGQIIRIGAEYMAITATTATTITVVRGYNGTTATSHDNSATINTFNVQDEIVRACALITAFNYQSRGKFERVRFDGINASETIEIPEEARELLAMFTIRDALGVYGGG